MSKSVKHEDQKFKINVTAENFNSEAPLSVIRDQKSYFAFLSSIQETDIPSESEAKHQFDELYGLYDLETTSCDDSVRARQKTIVVPPITVTEVKTDQPEPEGDFEVPPSYIRTAVAKEYSNSLGVGDPFVYQLRQVDLDLIQTLNEEISSMRLNNQKAVLIGRDLRLPVAAKPLAEPTKPLQSKEKDVAFEEDIGPDISDAQLLAIIDTLEKLTKRNDPISFKIACTRVRLHVAPEMSLFVFRKIYDHWILQRQLLGRPLLRPFWPLPSPSDQSPFVVFRPRQVDRMSLRRPKRSATQNRSKISPVKNDLSMVMTIVSVMKKREEMKFVLSLVDTCLFNQMRIEMSDPSYAEPGWTYLRQQSALMAARKAKLDGKGPPSLPTDLSTHLKCLCEYTFLSMTSNPKYEPNGVIGDKFSERPSAVAKERKKIHLSITAYTEKTNYYLKKLQHRRSKQQPSKSPTIEPTTATPSSNITPVEGAKEQPISKNQKKQQSDTNGVLVAPKEESEDIKNYEQTSEVHPLLSSTLPRTKNFLRRIVGGQTILERRVDFGRVAQQRERRDRLVEIVQKEHQRQLSQTFENSSLTSPSPEETKESQEPKKLPPVTCSVPRRYLEEASRRFACGIGFKHPYSVKYREVLDEIMQKLQLRKSSLDCETPTEGMIPIDRKRRRKLSNPLSPGELGGVDEAEEPPLFRQSKAAAVSEPCQTVPGSPEQATAPRTSQRIRDLQQTTQLQPSPERKPKTSSTHARLSALGVSSSADTPHHQAGSCAAPNFPTPAAHSFCVDVTLSEWNVIHLEEMISVLESIRYLSTVPPDKSSRTTTHKPHPSQSKHQKHTQHRNHECDIRPTYKELMTPPIYTVQDFQDSDVPENHSVEVLHEDFRNRLSFLCDINKLAEIMDLDIF